MVLSRCLVVELSGQCRCGGTFKSTQYGRAGDARYQVARATMDRMKPASWRVVRGGRPPKAPDSGRQSDHGAQGGHEKGAVGFSKTGRHGYRHKGLR